VDHPAGQRGFGPADCRALRSSLLHARRSGRHAETKRRRSDSESSARSLRIDLGNNRQCMSQRVLQLLLGHSAYLRPRKHNTRLKFACWRCRVPLQPLRWSVIYCRQQACDRMDARTAV
jgi:hypothetical protein